MGLGEKLAGLFGGANHQKGAPNIAPGEVGALKYKYAILVDKIFRSGDPGGKLISYRAYNMKKGAQTDREHERVTTTASEDLEYSFLTYIMESVPWKTSSQSYNEKLTELLGNSTDINNYPRLMRLAAFMDDFCRLIKPLEIVKQRILALGDNPSAKQLKTRNSILFQVYKENGVGKDDVIAIWSLFETYRELMRELVGDGMQYVNNGQLEWIEEADMLLHPNKIQGIIE